MRWLGPLCLLAVAGTLLVATEVPALRRRALGARLRPYLPGAVPDPAASPPGPAAIGAAARNWGDRVAAAAGVAEPLDRRLARAGSPLDGSGFRLRQVVGAVLALVAAGATTAALRIPPPVAVLVVGAAPLLAVLVAEQQVAGAIAQRDAERAAALPVVAEQLGMLLAAGWSLGAAVARLGRRGRGVVAEDLGRVAARTRQGLSDVAALQEWADATDQPAVQRLVDVLALHHHTGDLGRLVAEEARAMRADAHRELLAAIERRGQQVWVPVTVATLVPGLLFLAVPFVHALSRFAAT